MVEPEEESQTQAIPPKSKNILDDREAALMEFDLDLHAFWPLDPIHFSSNPTSPPLFSSTDQPCSPLWGFPDGDADNDDKLAGQVDQALSDRPQFSSSSCIPDPGREIPRENEDRRMLTSPFLGLEPVENPDAYCLIKEKITQALRQLKELTDQHVLAQVWAPVKNGGRMASLMYMFSVDGESDGMLGLPGRVFQQKLPEWTPNVQYYSIKEYPRLGQAQHYNVQGTLALPVFEPSGRSCVGVLELIMTSPKINYASEVDKVCKALEAVSLKSSDILDHTSMQIQICNEGRQTALTEILEILTLVCETHKLPLAQIYARLYSLK
ncbi:hypothetical protein CerSpe_050630 [Prunus speciosa]